MLSALSNLICLGKVPALYTLADDGDQNLHNGHRQSPQPYFMSSVLIVLASSAIMCFLLIYSDDADVPKVATSSMVPPNLNKLPVVGQTPYMADGPDPQQTPTPLQTKDKQTPLQIYETDRPFFGSAPVGGLDILCSKPALALVLVNSLHAMVGGVRALSFVRRLR